jgi:hypothetical protein
MTDDRSDISDARYGEVVLYILQYIRTRIRMCTHARWSCGSVCFMTAEEA